MHGGPYIHRGGPYNIHRGGPYIHLVNQFNSDLAEFIIATLQALAFGQIWSEEHETFFLMSWHMYVLEVSGDFHLDTFLAMWHRMSGHHIKSFMFLRSIFAKSRGLQRCDNKVSQIRIELINYTVHSKIVKMKKISPPWHRHFTGLVMATKIFPFPPF